MSRKLKFQNGDIVRGIGNESYIKRAKVLDNNYTKHRIEIKVLDCKYGWVNENGIYSKRKFEKIIGEDLYFD